MQRITAILVRDISFFTELDKEEDLNNLDFYRFWLFGHVIKETKEGVLISLVVDGPSKIISSAPLMHHSMLFYLPKSCIEKRIPIKWKQKKTRRK